jgi:hypothetical protein
MGVIATCVAVTVSFSLASTFDRFNDERTSLTSDGVTIVVSLTTASV